MAESIGSLYSKVVKQPPTPLAGASSSAWDDWNKRVGVEYKNFKKTMHLKHRLEFKEELSKYAKAVERSRKHSIKCKKFFSHIDAKVFTPAAAEMKVNGKYLSPEEILVFEPKNLDEHMSGRKKTFHNDVATESDIQEDVYLGEHGKRLVANPFCALTENGERLRKQVADQSSGEWELSVPTELHEFYKLGDRKIETERYDGIFDSPVDFDDFDTLIKVIKDIDFWGKSK